MNGYPRWFSRMFITFVTGVVFLTGCLLVPTTIDLRLQWDFPWRLEVGYRTWVVVLHVICGFGLFSVLGALWSIHMRAGWRRGKKRWSGAFIVGLIFALGLTGIGIYYLGNESMALVDSLAHVVLGFLLIPIFLRHIFQQAAARHHSSPSNNFASTIAID